MSGQIEVSVLSGVPSNSNPLFHCLNLFLTKMVANNRSVGFYLIIVYNTGNLLIYGQFGSKIDTFREKLSLSMSDRQESRSGMPAGSFTVSNMVSCLMVRCLVMRALDMKMILLILSLRKLLQDNMFLELL